MTIKKYKVCYVLSTSEKTGGANKSLLDLLSSIDRNRIDPVVLMRRNGNIQEVLKDMDIPYYVIPYINGNKTGNLLKDAVKRITEPYQVSKIRKLFLKIQPDLVHNNSLPALSGMEAAREMHIPYIDHIRENVEYGLHWQFLNKLKHYDIMRHADLNIAISDYLKDYYQKDIPDGNFITLHDGININDYLDTTKNIFQNAIVEVSVYGYLGEQKNQKEALDAFQELIQKGYSNLILNFIGNLHTEYADHLRQEAEQHHLANVHFIDNIADPSSLKARRKQDDIVLIPARNEGLGRTAIETMLAGSLVIGASSGATPELITDKETGFLYQSGNPAKLADCIEYALQNKESSRKIAEQGRDYAQNNFSLEDYAKKMLDIYESILSE
jgi:glycosyltransferase involved in cell wall biosynthesis